MKKKLVLFFLSFAVIVSLFFNIVSTTAEAVSPIGSMHSMPAKGNIKALVIRVGFKDYPLYTEKEIQTPKNKNNSDDKNDKTNTDNNPDTSTIKSDKDTETDTNTDKQNADIETDTNTDKPSEDTKTDVNINKNDEDTKSDTNKSNITENKKQEETVETKKVLTETEYCLSKDKIKEYFMGTGTSSADYPYDSLNAYYLRSSYGKLNIRLGQILEYTSPKERSYYTQGDTAEKEMELLSEIMAATDAEVDLSEYDSDGDNVADAVYIIYGDDPGPSKSITFTPHCRMDLTSSIIADGTRITHFVMMGLDDKNTLMHETGHLLGLQDYYSKNDKYALFGTSDMMFDNSGDHNGFSKWLLGWITDENVVFLDKTDIGKKIKLTPIDSETSEGKKIAVIAPDKVNSKYGQYLMVEYVSSKGNMSDLIGGTFPPGFRIFRVNAKLNENGEEFLYNNSDEKNLLLQVLNHDNNYPYDSIFREGMSVSPYSNPSSELSGGVYTGFYLKDFTTGDSPSFVLGYEEKKEADDGRGSTTKESENNASKSNIKQLVSADTGEEFSPLIYLVISVASGIGILTAWKAGRWKKYSRKW